MMLLVLSEVKVQSKEDVKLDIVGDYKAKCRAPLLAMRNVEFNKKGVEVEQIGDEPPTAWIVLDNPGQSKSFKFAKEVKYTDEEFVGKDLGGSSVLLYVLIGVGVLLLLLAAFFIIRKVSGNKSKQ